MTAEAGHTDPRKGSDWWHSWNIPRRNLPTGETVDPSVEGLKSQRTQLR